MGWILDCNSSSERNLYEFSSSLSSAEVEEKLDGFLSLRRGWHFGEGVPPPLKRISLAKRLNRMARQHGLPTDVFPGINGEVQICVYFGNECLEITVEENDEITLSHEVEENGVARDIDIQEELTAEQAEEKIAEFGIQKWPISSGFFMPSIGTDVENGLEVLLSKIHRTGAEYRFYQQTA